MEQETDHTVLHPMRRTAGDLLNHDRWFRFGVISDVTLL
jgi:hypothetical protein